VDDVEFSEDQAKPSGEIELVRRESSVRSYPKADLGLRIKASMADGFMVFLLFLIPFILGCLLEEHSGLLLKLSVVGWFFGFLYILFRDGIRGASWGKRRKGLQVISIRTGEPCGLMGSFVRNSIGLVPLIGFLDLILIFVHERGQRLGDRIMQMQVVEVGDSVKGSFEEDAYLREPAEELIRKGSSGEQSFLCGSCQGEIHLNQKTCPHCGVEIDWQN
jgi:uncharacterized RDD family membrane protein YckC